MAPHHLLVQRHRPQPWVRLQQRHDLLLEDSRQRVRTPPPPRLLLLRRLRIRLDPVGRCRAEPRPRRRQRGTVLLPVNQVELLGSVMCRPGTWRLSARREKFQTSRRPRPPPLSLPDCRWLLILIVALTPVDRSRTGIPPRDRSALPCEPGRRLCQDVPLHLHPAKLTLQLAHFLAFDRDQAVLAKAIVPVGLLHPPHPIATGQHGYRLPPPTRLLGGVQTPAYSPP